MPTLLRGVSEIAAHIGIGKPETQHLHTMRALPTFQVGGTPFATAGALDDWKALRAAGTYPTK